MKLNTLESHWKLKFIFKIKIIQLITKVNANVKQKYQFKNMLNKYDYKYKILLLWLITFANIEIIEQTK